MVFDGFMVCIFLDGFIWRVSSSHAVGELVTDRRKKTRRGGVSGGVQGGNTDSSIRQLVGNIPAAVAVTKKTPTDPRFIIETLQVGRAALPCIGLCGFVTLHVTLHVTAFFKNGVLLAFRFRLNGGIAGALANLLAAATARPSFCYTSLHLCYT
ncbi:hypothetical protein [Thiothrix lacustris]|uniref:hypothetical protein n=1 Tax=Thiothrix lacustris TaxID=525917 RepID=UPI0027E4DC24|nr:hypothetical protein [Thiothrix lacustris]WMP16949.1 hypothetical protein RCS87_16440 [Thiothrix lacustris]